MWNESNGPVDSRPILILLSESPAMLARVRSHQRDVRRWMPVNSAAAADVFTGDPASSSSYEWARSARGVTAVIDLHPPERARAALSALRAVRNDAAVLLLSDDVADLDGESDGTLARPGSLRDVLRVDLDDELRRLEAERRSHCLRSFAADANTVPILIHDDPDPDALSSALAVSWLLGGSQERNPIVTLGPIARPENRRMADLLHIRVTEVTMDELRRFDRIITVDTQPRELQVDGRPRVAVIDHHPVEDTYAPEFSDVRPEYGATATMMTEYLRAAGTARVSTNLATALLHGIRTDTKSLSRGATPADVDAYAFLQERADLLLVRRLERPSYAPATARAFGDALSTLDYDDDLCVAYIGTLEADDAFVLADLADFCLSIENVIWVVAAAWLEDGLALTLRHAGGGTGAGSLAGAIARHGGSGGGHATMARVQLPLERAQQLLGTDRGSAGAEAIRAMVRREIDGLAAEVSRRDSRPARPASTPAGSSR
ncbi:hypothetical protein BH23GEM9_BH23GEM9_33690 [soil metagenome]